MNINKQILRLALPSIATNITVPLLGVCDTAVSGHLGAEKYLGAIAVGTMAVNSVFWCLGFLRSGTTGLTAQAYGRGDGYGQRLLFTRAVLIALFIGLLFIVAQGLLSRLILGLIDAAMEVTLLASRYFALVILAAPATLATMAINGWLLGMQTSVAPMIISLSTNVINIVASIIFAFPLGLGFIGTALGTLTAGWLGLFIALLMAIRHGGGRLPWIPLKQALRGGGWGRFFSVNVFIFLRSFCIMAVTMGMTSMQARLGTHILAAGTVMMQFFMFFSYFMDGFAFAAEALTGRAVGRGHGSEFHRTVKAILLWGAGITLLFTAVYAGGWRLIANLLTDMQSTLTLIASLKIWLWVLPAAGAAAFVFDGVYIGLTATRAMLESCLIGLAAFFLLAWLRIIPGADGLWLSFTVYLALRGGWLWAGCRRQARRAFVK